MSIDYVAIKLHGQWLTAWAKHQLARDAADCAGGTDADTPERIRWLNAAVAKSKIEQRGRKMFGLEWYARAFTGALLADLGLVTVNGEKGPPFQTLERDAEEYLGVLREHWPQWVAEDVNRLRRKENAKDGD